MGVAWEVVVVWDRIWSNVDWIWLRFMVGAGVGVGGIWA